MQNTDDINQHTIKLHDTYLSGPDQSVIATNACNLAYFPLFRVSNTTATSRFRIDRAATRAAKAETVARAETTAKTVVAVASTVAAKAAISHASSSITHCSSLSSLNGKHRPD